MERLAQVLVANPEQDANAAHLAAMAAVVDRERATARQALREAFADGPPDGCVDDCMNGEMVLWEREFHCCPLADDARCPAVLARGSGRLDERMVAMGIGQRYLRASLDGVAEGIRHHISDYADHVRDRVADGRGLLLIGGTGTGKTCALVVVARAALAAGVDGVIWRYVPELMADIHNGRSESAQERVDAAAAAPLLLLDDFGAAYPAEWGVAQFDALVERRYSRALATCISTNASGQALMRDPLWQRVVSRWRETCTTIGTGSDDRRLQVAP